MPQELIDLSEIRFEPKDTEIFKIPDVQTRISTLQNYFFPRMEVLLRHTLDRVQQIYGINPYERMTFSYRPTNRPDAKHPHVFPQVHFGLRGKTIRGHPLTSKKKNGEPYYDRTSRLRYVVFARGSIRVDFRPFQHRVNKEFVEAISTVVEENSQALTAVLALNRIAYNIKLYSIEGDSIHLGEIKDAFTFRDDKVLFTVLSSPTYYFPLDINRGLETLIQSFAALYPLIDLVMSIEDGTQPRLADMLNRLNRWYVDKWTSGPPAKEPIVEEGKEESSIPDIPQLDSYTFVRAGLWWSVLARDNWTCCSCGRSTRKHGVVLHVDHIVPRSKGGTDDMDNLQTMCSKCNIGKSNRDDTDLRNLK